MNGKNAPPQSDLLRLPACLGWLCLEFLGLVFVCNCEFATWCWSAFEKSTTSQTDPGKGGTAQFWQIQVGAICPYLIFVIFGIPPQHLGLPVKSAPKMDTPDVCFFTFSREEEEENLKKEDNSFPK